MVTAQLICAFVFTYAYCWVSYVAVPLFYEAFFKACGWCFLKIVDIVLHDFVCVNLLYNMLILYKVEFLKNSFLY